LRADEGFAGTRSHVCTLIEAFTFRHFVARKTFEMQDGSNDKTQEALANTNLQSAESLLEGKSA
jgi:hypothetical protein